MYRPLKARALAPTAVILLAACAQAAANDGTAPGVTLQAEKNLCPDPASPVAVGTAQWNGWGRDLDNSRYQPEPAIRASDVPKLAVKWAYGFQGGTAYGQPTIVDGRVFVTSSAGRVYSLDATTGCTYWTYDAAAGVRAAISIGALGIPKRAVVPKKSKQSKQSKRSKHTPAHLDILKAPSAALFGDDAGAVYALDAQKGTLLWKTQVDAHPLARIVGAPTLFRDRLYVAVSSVEDNAAANSSYGCCTFRGSVVALDIAGGHVLWKTYTVAEEPQPYRKSGSDQQEIGPAGAAVSSSPTIDAERGVLYVGTGNSYTDIDLPLADAVLALDLSDGKPRWVKKIPLKESAGRGDFSSSPILRTLATGKQIVLAGQQSGVIYGLDPDHGGEILWQTTLSGSSAGGVEWGAAADHRSLYVAISGLLAEPVNTSGSLTALDMKTGVRRWQTWAPLVSCTWGERSCPHAQAQAVTVMPGIAFSGSMDGHLRAYSTIDGKIVWDFDTAKDFETVNGVKASGGSLNLGGATIVNGIVYVNSGYGQPVGQAGNVLLAFSVVGK